MKNKNNITESFAKHIEITFSIELTQNFQHCTSIDQTNFSTMQSSLTFEKFLSQCSDRSNLCFNVIKNGKGGKFEKILKYFEIPRLPVINQSKQCMVL